MGTESFNVPGKIHLAYWSSASTATRINAIYYTQISYYEPSYTPVPQIYYYYEGWSTPQGQIIDNNAWASGTYPVPTITTFTRTVGAETLWMPGVAWTDYRNPTYDIYFTTLDTMFSVTFFSISRCRRIAFLLCHSQPTFRRNSNRYTRHHWTAHLPHVKRKRVGSHFQSANGHTNWHITSNIQHCQLPEPWNLQHRRFSSHRRLPPHGHIILHGNSSPNPHTQR